MCKYLCVQKSTLEKQNDENKKNKKYSFGKGIEKKYEKGAEFVGFIRMPSVWVGYKLPIFFSLFFFSAALNSVLFASQEPVYSRGVYI